MAALLALVGCSSSDEGVPLARRMFAVAGEEQPPSQDERRQRKRYGSDPPVYVDGKYKGMLKYSELPPNTPTWAVKLEDGRYVTRFKWIAYFEALGVEVGAIRAAHFYGGRGIISVVTGEELRKHVDTFGFSFTRGESGKARTELPPEGIEYNTFVDKLRAVAVYVDETPPKYERQTLTLPDGSTMKVQDAKGRMNIPYGDGEQHGGTRVYLDGKFIDAFRRRALKPELQLNPADRGSPFRLSEVLKSQGVDLSKVKRMQLANGRDAVIADVSGEELRNKILTFNLVQHSRGKIRVEELSPDKVSSVLLYSELEPADRSLPESEAAPESDEVPLEDQEVATDPAPGAGGSDDSDDEGGS